MQRRRRSKKEPVTSSINYKKIGISVVVILIVLAAGWWVYTWLQKDSGDSDGAKPTPTLIPITSKTDDTNESTPTPKPTGSEPEPTNTPVPTPTPNNENVGSYTIQILNGNGIAGSANEVQALLEEKGYHVVSTDNAYRWDYGKTEIRAKSSVPESVVDGVNNVISTLYDTTVELNSDTTGEVDIRVVLGRDKP